jgi:hypothetical protein
VGPSRLEPKSMPKRLLGNSETRNLKLGRPSGLDPRGPRNLGNSESGIWVSLCLGPKRGPLGNSETRNLEFGGPSGSDPRGVLGNSETRNLEFAEEYPGICTLGILETGICGGVSWNLHTWKHGIWILGSLCGPTEGPRKLGSSESGICRVPWRICSTLGNMESGIWVSVTARLPPPPPPRALGDRSSLPGPSPPWSTVGQQLFVNGHLMIYMCTDELEC